MAARGSEISFNVLIFRFVSVQLHSGIPGNGSWFGIDHLRFGFIDIPVNQIAMVVVFLRTPT
jgi:hypothetical protein